MLVACNYKYCLSSQLFYVSLKTYQKVKWIQIIRWFNFNIKQNKARSNRYTCGFHFIFAVLCNNLKRHIIVKLEGFLYFLFNFFSIISYDKQIDT